eukprot:TRINITY_DN3367_c0_g1_i1.p1 TRINITY_DN3367_c0_g1~~TRINITY_DN3367_c0_g1_i1.p1  ORF type:complete len:285 (-),score=37.69 TRINITY_DN3367_c0_g1_i1:29-883(-)
MNISDHSPTFSSGARVHPMDVIVRAVETEGIVEVLNRLKKRDIRRLLRECTNSETKPEGSKRSLKKELEQRWVSVGVKKFLKKHIHSPQNLNMLSTALSLNLHFSHSPLSTITRQPLATSDQGTNVTTPTTPTTTDRIAVVEAITREITTLGNQIFHEKVPNEDVVSFIESRQKQQTHEDSINTLSSHNNKRNHLPVEGEKKKERRLSNVSFSISIPRINTDSISISPRGNSSRKVQSPSNSTATSTSPTTTLLISPPTPEKSKKLRKQENGLNAGTRVKQPKF